MCINLNENAFLTLLLFDSCLPFAVADKAEEEKASVGGTKANVSVCWSMFI